MLTLMLEKGGYGYFLSFLKMTGIGKDVMTQTKASKNNLPYFVMLCLCLAVSMTTG